MGAKVISFEEYYEKGNLLGQNSAIFLQYVDHLKDDVKKTDSTKAEYLKKSIKFLEKTNKYISDISLVMLEKFLDTIKADNTKTTYYYALKDFFQFAKSQEIMQFEPDDTDVFKIPHNRMEKPNAANPLSLDDVINLREKLQAKYRLRFTFEMVYSYNLSLAELVNCSKSTYDFDTKSFSIRPKPLTIYSQLAELIELHSEIILQGKGQEGGKSKSTYQKQFNDMGALLNRPIKHEDIKQTHLQHSMKCVLCLNTYLCESDYWCLAIHNKDKSGVKRFICKSCALENGAVK